MFNYQWHYSYLYVYTTLAILINYDLLLILLLSYLQINIMKQIIYLVILNFFFLKTTAQDIRNNPGSNHGNRFEQLGTILPSPNEYRAASGAPGSKYWQQRCDYKITCEIDEPNRRLNGKETLTFLTTLLMHWIIYGFSWMKTSTVQQIMPDMKIAMACRSKYQNRISTECKEN